MIASFLLCFSLPTVAGDAAVEAMAEYLMFQEYESGIILLQQIDQSVFEAVTFIDTDVRF